MNEIQFSISDGERHLKSLEHEFNSETISAIRGLLKDLIDAGNSYEETRMVFLP